MRNPSINKVDFSNLSWKKKNIPIKHYSPIQMKDILSSYLQVIPKKLLEINPNLIAKTSKISPIRIEIIINNSYKFILSYEKQLWSNSFILYKTKEWISWHDSIIFIYKSNPDLDLIIKKILDSFKTIEYPNISEKVNEIIKK